MQDTSADAREDADHTSRDTIVLWGATRSGKSGLVGSLYGLLHTRTKQPRWTAHPRDALTEGTALELMRAYLDLQHRGYRKTDVRKPEYLHLNIRKLKGDRDLDVVQLYLLDPAGEIMTQKIHRESDVGASVYRHAASSRGLIWLVSVENSKEDRSQSQAAILPELVALLEACGGDQVDIPVAICLSMIDRLPGDKERARALADPRSALRSQIGESVPRWFEALCPRHKYFAISSAGLREGTVEPINVSEVLDWIVKQGRSLPKRTSVSLVAAWPEGAQSASSAVGGESPSNVSALDARRPTGWPLARPLVALAAIGSLGWAGFTYAPSVRKALAASNVIGRAARAPATAPSTGVAGIPPRSSGAAAATSDLARRDETWRRATATIDSVPPGSHDAIPARYARAHACVTAQLQCDPRQVARDYIWVRGRGTIGQRAEARRALDSLRRLGGTGLR